jgi:hypothetical protein
MFEIALIYCLVHYLGRAGRLKKEARRARRNSRRF